jgi:hypothetical protein
VSIQDERELRDRLTGLLEDVTPKPAPVTRAAAQGKGIRLRRWASAIAVVAVVAAGAAATPALLRVHHASPASRGHRKSLHYTVRLQQLGSKAGHGVIAAGVTDGKHWSVVMSGPAGSPAVQTDTQGELGSIYEGPVVSGWPVSFQGDSSSAGFITIVATVTRGVGLVTISLPHGALRLTPVSWGYSHWIGVVLPDGVPAGRAVVYTKQGRELAYSVPFGDNEFTVWWAPGQKGPARVTRTIGAGVIDGHRWRAAAAFGPWGYCYTSVGGSDCIDSTTNPEMLRPGTLASPLECGPVDNTRVNAGAPITGIATVARDVGTVVLKYSNGTSASFPSTQVSGGRSLGYSIPAHVNVVRSVEYSPSGQVVGSTNGQPWNC